MGDNLYQLLPACKQLFRCRGVLKTKARTIFCVVVLLLTFSAGHVRAQYEGFPIAASPCASIGTGYNTYLYLGTAQEGYEYHWYKGEDYTATYLGSTNVALGGIGADIEVTSYGPGDYVCYVTLEGYHPDPVNFLYASSIYISEYDAVPPVITSTGGTALCDDSNISFHSTIAETVWYLNGAYYKSAKDITVSVAGTYKAYANYCEIQTGWSNEITVTTGCQPPAPVLNPTTNFPVRGETNYIYVTNADSQYEYHWYKGTDLNGLFLGNTTSLKIIEGGDYVCYAVNPFNNTNTSAVIFLDEFPTAPVISAAKSEICNNELVKLTVQNYDVVRYRYDWYKGNDLNGQFIGTDLETIEVDDGGNFMCYALDRLNTWKATASKIITINESFSPPPPSVSADASAFCSGSGTTLHATGSGVYWVRDGVSVGNGNDIWITAAGVYRAFSVNNCGTSSASSEIMISVGYPPEKPSELTAVATTLKCGENTGSITVNAVPSAGASLSYSLQGVTTFQTENVFMEVPPGTYTVVIKASNNCGETIASLSVSVTANREAIPEVPVISAAGDTDLCDGAGVVLSSSVPNVEWYRDGILITQSSTYTANIAGSYTARSVNICGFSAVSNTLTVSVSATTAAPVISAEGSTTFCTGGSVTLTATGAAIQWYKDNTVISGENAASYTVTSSGTYTAKSINKCGVSPSSAPVVVSVSSSLPDPPVIAASGSPTICDGGSVTLTANSDVVWLHNGLIVGSGKTLQASLKGEYSARTANSCGNSSFSNTINVNVTPALRVKTSRFDQVMSATDVNESVADTATLMREGLAQLSEQIAIACETRAEAWMEALGPGLENYSQPLRETLRSKLIEICKAGGDLSHLSGASVLPSGKVSASGYTSFAEAMKDILGLSKFSTALNPWLWGSPYPYGPRLQATEKSIGNTDSLICAAIAQLKSDHQAAQPTATFYQYLLSRYQDAMTLGEAQLEMLLKSCGGCNYILPEDVPMPVFLEPGTQGCITASDFALAKAALNEEFAGGLDQMSDNYEIIVSTYLNHRWGFSLSFTRYKEFEEQILINPSSLLCNEPVFTSVDVDPYAGVKDLIAVAAGNGKREYAAYIMEEANRFRQAYIDTCSAAKASVNMTREEQVYHYTLYYYDQADNLVRTVPPEGVRFLSDKELDYVSDYRAHIETDCAGFDGPAGNSNKITALQTLSNVLAADTARAIEMWLYNPENSSQQVMATTPDNRYLFQACMSEDQLNVDVYSMRQDSSGAVTIFLSNHASADLAGLMPLHPWTHLVVQGNSLASGPLQLYLNGKARPAANPSLPSGCGWEINNSSKMPENLSTLKHLRFYDRLMGLPEIAGNAANGCFMIDPSLKPQLRSNLLAWYRFNTPEPGTPTTVAGNSTSETRYIPIYPAHGLLTSYAYNSTNQVTKQHTPDGGTSLFWYDNLSRLTASQNAEQKKGNRFSYTTYDLLGRITEVGEKTYPGAGLAEPHYLDSTAVNTFLAGGDNRQVTQTLYDSIPVPGNGIQALMQDNLRKRVAASLYREGAASAVSQASYYSYDLNGNVKSLYQSVYGLGIKQIDYEYDLVSGKVNFVRYQAGHPDQFYYQYKYDAENRLIEAWSGTQALLKPFGRSYLMNGKLDASYEYYLHGPLARVELGDQYGKVQGVDYAYTLQGWLKGVNGQKLDAAKDMGQDGAVIAKDVLAYSLGYYAGDLKPIGGAGSSAFGMEFLRHPGDITGQSLYNGNISNTTVAISKFRNGQPVGYTYKYDQLSRLKEMRQHELSNGANTWDAASITDKYRESISYDGNGNILTFLRNGTNEGGKPLKMDNLAYGYKKDGNDMLLNNRLRHVKDQVNSASYQDDIDNQGDDNYQYDAIGNLIKDSGEGIDSIRWTLYGKIKSIHKNNGTNILYHYDPSGNRVSKMVNGLMTWYVRDAQGNTMGVYDNWNCGINWKEQQLYGSSRLGMWRPNINLNTVTDSSLSVWDTIGKKGYELTNHLGNVMAVISDKRILSNSGAYEADVVSAQDYYSFGSLQPGRHWSLGDSYRYGFNGKENDNEVKGEGNSVDFGARIYDSRIGRFLSIDPLQMKSPDYSPYGYAVNSPISYKDEEGKYAIFIHYILVKFLLKKAGVSDVQAKLLAHYASVYADNPGGRNKSFHSGKGDLILMSNQMNAYKSNEILNEVGGPLTDESERSYFLYQTSNDSPLGVIDYSATQNSQSEDPEAQLLHGTRTFSESNKVSAQQAVNRSMMEAWVRLFNSASVKLEEMTANSSAIENFGQAVHGFPDVEAHRGAVFRATLKNIFGFLSRDGNDHNLHNDSHPNKSRFGIATFYTANAILVHQILTKDFSQIKNGGTISVQGMTGKQFNILKATLSEGGFKMQKTGGNYSYSISKGRN